MLWILLAACLRGPAPEPFPVPVPALEAPEAAAWPPAPDDCPGPVPLLPGRPFPYVDEQGRGTCRGQVLTEEAVAELLQAEALATYWQGAAEVCSSHRTADRELARAYVGDSHRRWLECEQDLRVERWATVGGVAAGVVFGVVVGATAARIGGAGQ